MPMQTKTVTQFARAGRAGLRDIADRVPELKKLPNASVAVFGLGCIGAPSAIELARCGVGELRLLDPDFVDPSAIARWPLGLAAAGLPKVEAVKEMIRVNYSRTKVSGHVRKLGSVRHEDVMSDLDLISRMAEGISLIYDATAEWGVQHFLSDFALEHRIPYVAVDGTQGGWGGRVCRITPGQTEGCWTCYQLWLEEGKIIRQPPASPTKNVQPAGCADPTFTGAGFDLTQIALTGVRMAVSSLCAGEAGGYPLAAWDVMSIAFRDPAGQLIPPLFEAEKLTKHPRCARCQAS
jgi:molybdopterin/thiamine biosynthesis adenylyltransferase